MVDQRLRDEWIDRLIAGKTIEYRDVVFYPTPVSEIIEMKVTEFDRVILPFTLTLSVFKDTGNFSVLECILRNRELYDSLVAGLKLVTKCDAVKWFANRVELRWGDERRFVIDGASFDDISELVVLMQGTRKIQESKKLKCASPTMNAAMERLYEGRKRAAEKNAVKFHDIINICLWGGGYMIPQNIILDMSMWQLINCYKAKVGSKSYDDDLVVAVASGDGKSVSGQNYWMNRLKIGE